MKILLYNKYNKKIKRATNKIHQKSIFFTLTILPLPDNFR